MGISVDREKIVLRKHVSRIVIPSEAEGSFSSPFSHDSFAKPFTGSTAPTFSRYGVSRFSLSDTRPLTANEKDPSTPLGMTIREERVSHTFFV